MCVCVLPSPPAAKPTRVSEETAQVWSLSASDALDDDLVSASGREGIPAATMPRSQALSARILIYSDQNM